MFEYLKDTDNTILQNRISSLIDTQLPSFVEDEGPQFAEFLKIYYKWMESNELTIGEIKQNEFNLSLETSSSFLIEDSNNLILENTRTSSSAFEKNEKVIGQTSGATGLVDRITTIESTKIYIKNVGKKDFLKDEIIIGSNNRTEAKVLSYIKNPLFASRSLLSNRDINSTTTNFLDYFKTEFLNNIPTELTSDKRLIIKHIVDVYRAKGTSASYDFLFKSLYDIQDLIYYTPKEDLLKPSSGNWSREKSLRITTSDSIDKFESRTITGKSSSATAIVDRVETFAAGILQITELFLTNITGNFVVGEIVTSNEIDGVSGTGIAQGILTNVNIVGAGTEYKVGDPITISGGGGTEASAKVKEVGAGALTSIFVFDGGDGYIKDKDLTVNNFGTGGSGLAGKIQDVAETFTFSINEDIIGEYSTINLNDGAFGLSGCTINGVYNTLISTLGFSKFDSGTISRVQVPAIGQGYSSFPTITAIEPDSNVFVEDSVRIMNLNPDPDGLASSNAVSGTFRHGERLTSNNGNKVGTFYGLVSNTESFSDPTRMRIKTTNYTRGIIDDFKPFEYLIGSGRNDLLVNNNTNINSTLPAVYDIKFVDGGDLTVNTIVYRRGINATLALDSGDNAGIDFLDSSTEKVSVTGDFQVLNFPIDQATLSGSTVTVTSYGNHGLDNDQKIIITGADDAGYNGEHVITVDVNDPNLFTYSILRTVSRITRIGSTATATTSNNNGLVTGTSVTLSGATASEYNDTFTITKISNTQFTFTVSGTPTDEIDASITLTPQGLTSPATNTTDSFVYNENVSVKFTLPFGHLGGSSPDRYLISSIDFDRNERITGLVSNASSVVNTGVVFSPGGKLGENSLLGISEAGTGSIKEIEITDVGVGFVTAPTVSISGIFGGNNVVLTANIGTIGDSRGKYLDQNGFLSSNKKIFDGNYYQDYSYSLISNKQLSDYEEVIKKLLHPAGTKMFGEFAPPAQEIAMDFDHLIVLEDGSRIKRESDNGNLLAEKTFEETHGISFKKENLVSGTISIKGGSDLVTGIGTDFTLDFPEDEKILIDDEQGFTVSYGEFLLENNLNGNISTDSGNVISRCMFSNLTANFTPNSVVTQISSNNDNIISGIVLNHELDDSNNNVLILHSCNGIFETTSNANSTVNSITAKFSSVESNVIFGTSTNFENDLRINDELEILSTKEKTKVLSVINSSCLIANSTISSDLSYFFKLGGNQDIEDLGVVLLEDGIPKGHGSYTGTTSTEGSLLLDERIANTSVYDNKTIKQTILNEPTLRGTTSANGINDGNFNIFGINSFYQEDVKIGDKIKLSSSELVAQVVSISCSTKILMEVNDLDYQNDVLIFNDDGNGENGSLIKEDSPDVEFLTTNVALGNGSSNQTFTLLTTRNLDLERSDTTLNLNIPYDGSNNKLDLDFLGSETGTLLLEDGIGTSNAGYIGTTSNEGSFKMELLSEFKLQIPKKLTV